MDSLHYCFVCFTDKRVDSFPPRRRRWKPDEAGICTDCCGKLKQRSEYEEMR